MVKALLISSPKSRLSPALFVTLVLIGRVGGVVGGSLLAADQGGDPGPADRTHVVACPNQCLSHFRYDSDDWTGERGEQPQRTNGLTSVDGYLGRAVRVGEGTNALLRYSGTEPSGKANFSLEQGTARFYYRPLWVGKPKEAKEGDWKRFIELGRWTPDASLGCFALTADPSGTNIWLLAQDNQGHSRSNLLGNPSRRLWFRTNRWSRFLFTYSRDHLRVWVDGIPMLDTPTKGWPLPPHSAFTEGFTLGSDSQGDHLAVGDYDELELLGYAQDPMEVENGSAWELRATVEMDPPLVILHWGATPGLETKIERWDPKVPGWKTLGSFRTYQYQDTDVQRGQRYEYRLARGTSRKYPGRIAVGVGLPPTEDRGRLILLVDRTINEALSGELRQFEEDLAGDGWEVVRQAVSRHDEANPARNRVQIARVRRYLRRVWAADPSRTRTLVIVGHVTIPYSSELGPDGHGKRPWPADVVYGDVDGEWTDTLALSRRNQPNDGVFDSSGSPSSVELAVGRVDFAELPALRVNGSETVADVEIRCLRQYLRKDHRYRLGEIDLPLRVVAATYFGNYHDVAIKSSVMKYLPRWSAPSENRLVSGDPFSVNVPALWGFLGGYGKAHAVRGRSVWHSAKDFSDPSKEPAIAFYLLKGSYFGVYPLPDNLLRSVLGGPSYGLASVWTMSDRWQFEAMSLGDTLGEALLRTQNDSANASYNVLYALQGDPTLRWPVEPAPRSLQANWTRNGVRLRWLAPETSVGPSRYRVYRSTRGSGGPFELLTTPAIEQTEFVDAEATTIRKHYLVRSERLVISPSGSYTNLSQGVSVNLR